MEHDELDAFWQDARVRAKINRVSGYLGVSGAEVLRPPAWSFGGDPAQADELLSAVLRGTKTAMSSARSDYDDDGVQLPDYGSLSIVLDGSGHPRALIRTTEVRIVRFEEVDAAHARAEAEGDGSVEDWRARHAVASAVRSDHRGHIPDPSTLMVLETFKVLVAAPLTDEDQLSPASAR